MPIQQGLYNPEVSNIAKETTGNLADIKLELQKLNSLAPGVFDYIGLTYDSGNNITQAVYKTGGASGTTISTLTMTYDASNNLLTLTKS